MNVSRIMARQGRPRIWLGAIRHMITRTQSYYSLMNVVLLLVTTYTVREATIQKWFPWLNFWWLLGIGAAAIIAVAAIDYKLVHPSEIAYNQSQAWKHRSPVRKELGQMQQSITAIQGALEDLKEAVNQLSPGGQDE